MACYASTHTNTHPCSFNWHFVMCLVWALYLWIPLLWLNTHLYINVQYFFFREIPLISFIYLYSEMGIHMLENILRIKCMGLESIDLQMDIGTREPGMRVEGKGLVCTRSELGKLRLGTGKMESLMFQAHKMQLILYLQLLLIIPKYSMRYRYLLFTQIFA